MKGKIIIFGIILLLFCLSLFFAYFSIHSEVSGQQDGSPLSNSKLNDNDTNKPSSNQKGKSTRVANGRYNQNIQSNENITSQSSSAPISEYKSNLDPDKEKIKIEITLFDGDQDILLSDYEIELLSNEKDAKREKFKTDKNGLVLFSVMQKGYIQIHFFTKDYSEYEQEYFVLNKKNKMKVVLYRGGTIEVRAVNLEGKKVEDLSINFLNDDLVTLPMIFEKAKDLYVMPNLQVGLQHIYFKAKGYLETPLYRINLDSKNVFLLEILLEPERIVIFDLDIPDKPNSIRIVYSELLSFIFHDNIEFISFKNEKGLYEFPLNLRDIRDVVIYIDKYVPEVLRIWSNNNNYLLLPKKEIVSKVKIVNELGKAVVGAEIYYGEDELNSRSYKYKKNKELNYVMESTYTSQQAFSDLDGMVLLKGLKEKMELNITINHQSYCFYDESWDFDAKSQEIKVIELVVGNQISGNIKFNEIGVKNAEVILQKKGSDSNIHQIVKFISNEDGSYVFRGFNFEDKWDYFLQAFHLNFGVVVSSKLNLETKVQVLDLALIKEKSITIKLVDINGKPMPNQKIMVKRGGYFLNVPVDLTDEKGECAIYNLEHLEYDFFLQDEKLFIENNRFLIPHELVVLTVTPIVEPKDLKKIIVTLPDGSIYKGLLIIDPLVDICLPFYAMNEGNGKFNFKEYLSVSKLLVFEAPGFAFIRFGPYEDIKDIPMELKAQLIVGESLKIKVVDDTNNKPIPFCLVELLIEEEIVRSLPANRQGEVQFTHLNGKYNVITNVATYQPYKEEVEISDSKEITLRLVKGGQFKGHLTRANDVEKSWIGLNPSNRIAHLDENGNFEFYNMYPGEYTINVHIQFKNGNIVDENYSNIIKIESEKTLEMELDGVLKK